MSAKTMKGKQAILRYLETHRTFTSPAMKRVLMVWGRVGV